MFLLNRINSILKTMRYLLILLNLTPFLHTFASPDSLPPAPYKVKYKIIRPGQDNVACALLLTDSTGISTQLANCLVHDRTGPFYHWLNDSLILYEYCNNSNYERIRVMNVHSKSVVLEKRGFVKLFGDNTTLQNIDTFHRKLVYFTPNDTKDGYYYVKVLDLDSLKTTTLIALATSGDSYDAPECTRINLKTRRVTIDYALPGHNGHKTIMVKY